MQVIVLQRKELGISGVDEALRELFYHVEEMDWASLTKKNWKESKPDLFLVSSEPNEKAFQFCKIVRDQKETRKVPIVLCEPRKTGEEGFEHQKTKEMAQAFVRLPAPTEDVLNEIEKLIGLPPVSFERRKTHEFSETSNPIELESLRREVLDLKEQVAFYQRQLDQVSVVGERESQEMDHLLKDLQDEVDKMRRQRDEYRDEGKILQNDLAEKTRILDQIEKTLIRQKQDAEAHLHQLKMENQELKELFEDNNEKHKRAQAALREYYKRKVEKLKTLEKEFPKLENDLKKAAEIAAEYQDRVKELEVELSEEKERTRKKVREAKKDLEAKVEDLEEQIDKAKKENDILFEKIDIEREKAKKAEEDKSLLLERLEAEKEKARKAKEALSKLKDVLG